ncbi:MAG TPA: glutathione S-transferase [Noviherbaspirillum sp.]|jgi:glutathione S-transferase|uniref:glutathione S-transferase family protein n=1 Tax=Noviherbaspirillum sp. TaxID=1926288 RepID=UPI002DDDBB15|nr:glutathione S-transferase [Noviherbaspirillum sp.]HEV2611523.1 glutathione S-transferase [Noviherbaspirillum sp.]
MPITKPAAPLRLHRHALSGHAHRIQLFLSLLDLPFEMIDVDLMKGAHKQPNFLSMKPFGQVPVLEDGDTIVYDSNAILVYLATRYDDGNWLPRDPVGAAKVQQWLSLAAGQIASGPATARLVTLFRAPLDHERAKTIAHNLLTVLDAELAGRRFAIGERPTIADVAAYSYIAHAPEGGVSLEPYANVRAWLGRVAELPGFVPMQSSNVGLLAA